MGMYDPGGLRAEHVATPIMTAATDPFELHTARLLQCLRRLMDAPGTCISECVPGQSS